MPQARAARAQPLTYNRRLHLLEPAALYHPNNPEVPGSSPGPAPVKEPLPGGLRFFFVPGGLRSRVSLGRGWTRHEPQYTGLVRSP